MTAPGHYGNNKLIITPNNKIGRCPGFIYEFAEYDCPCFLDPSPAAWEESTVYAQNEAVSYSSKTWYSTIVGDNQGNEPGVDAGWAEYTHFNNVNWDSIPPFGGIGKTPESYVFSAEIYLEKDDPDAGDPNFFSQHYHITGVVSKAAFSTCRWFALSGATLSVNYSYRYTDTDTPANNMDCSASVVRTVYSEMRYESGKWRLLILPVGANSNPNIGYVPDASCDVDGIATLGENGDIIYAESVGKYGVWIEYDGCIIEADALSIDDSFVETIGGRDIAHTATATFSWRPPDCDYEQWDSATSYSIDDCVAWNGKFYRSCQNVNQGNEPEDDATSICETGYYWRLT